MENKIPNLLVKATERAKQNINIDNEKVNLYDEGDHPFAATPKKNYTTGQIGKPNRFSMTSVLIAESAYKVLIG